MSDAAIAGQQRQSCYFIGIGGTGAKCAEALLHLSAAGLGPDRCTLMLVDQDEPNGNGERCLGILNNYIQLRRQLHNPAETGPPGDHELFRTEMAIPPGGATWCPSSQHGTLGEICNYDRLPPEQKALMDCLYLPQEREQKLDKGFRAHPSVGAAVMLSQTLEAEQFWQNVSNSIRAAREAVDVKIFLLGSIFGGTGAAGFPTIARLIRRTIAERGNKKVDVGGALMLPYFSFPAPSARTGELLPDSSAFIEQTHGALTYYNRLLGEEQLFDHIYLLGWQPLLEIGPYCEGGRQQNNPALIPELYAALAALHYFANGDAGSSPRVSYFSTRAPRRVEWDDLPRVRTDAPHEVRHSLGALIRFAQAYHAVYRPALTRENWRAVRHEAWFRRLIGSDGAKLDEPASQNDLLGRLDVYCAEVLRWAANIAFGAAATDELQLYRAAQFAHRITADDRFSRADLKSPGEVDRRGFGSLIDGEEGPDLPTIFDRLTDARRTAGRHGLVGLVSALHRACRRDA